MYPSLNGAKRRNGNCCCWQQCVCVYLNKRGMTTSQKDERKEKETRTKNEARFKSCNDPSEIDFFFSFAIQRREKIAQFSSIMSALLLVAKRESVPVDGEEFKRLSHEIFIRIWKQPIFKIALSSSRRRRRRKESWVLFFAQLPSEGQVTIETWSISSLTTPRWCLFCDINKTYRAWRWIRKGTTREKKCSNGNCDARKVFIYREKKRQFTTVAWW